MYTYTHFDPTLKFESKVEIGKYLVKVHIDGLPVGVFTEQNLSAFIHNSPKVAATLLQFYNCADWRIETTDAETFVRMESALTARKLPKLAAIVKKHAQLFPLGDSLNAYWRETIIPEIMHFCRINGVDINDNLNNSLAWCNPAVSGKKLHPRAMHFIDNHWPKIAEDHGKNVFVKSA